MISVNGEICMERLSRSEMVKQMKKRNKVRSYTRYKKVDTPSKPTELQAGDSETLDFKSFQFRMVIASFLFLLFLGMKEKRFQFQEFTYDNIIDVISNNSGMEAAEEFVITTFNALD